MNKHHASREWLHERIAGTISIPLLIWFIANLICTKGDATAFQAFLAKPWNAGLLILLIANFQFYSTLAMKVVFEDYVHNIKVRNSLIWLMRYAGFTAFALAVWSIITIYLKG